MEGSRKRLRAYHEKVSTCGEGRSSYAKTDRDVTLMRAKKGCMENDQLLTAYNFQMGVCNGCIAYTSFTNMHQIPNVFSQ